MKTTILILAMFVGSLYSANSQPVTTVLSDRTDWHKIGETTVNFNTDRDEISVIGADKFAAIKFKVVDVPIHLLSMEAHFDKGGKQNINVNFPIKPKGESRVIEFDGGEQDLKKIVFVYKTIANQSDRQARVELWGLKTNEDK
jgi:hypothetical protein